MLNIKCNNKPREVLYWHDLTPKQRKEFDYYETVDSKDEAKFFKYKGWIYDIGEFTRIDKIRVLGLDVKAFEKFDGMQSDSFFSGLLVKFVEDGESVIVARFTS